jgi:mono/diheme cytochrome c family protein
MKKMTVTKFGQLDCLPSFGGCHLFLFLFAACWLVPVAARGEAAPDPGAAVRQAFLERHCIACHDADSKEGGFDATALRWQADDAASLTRWAKVYDRVARGEMPPPDEDRPAPELRAAFLDTLAGGLTAAGRAHQAHAGRTVQRRLNRTEYVTTIHDFLGIDTPLADLLPEDGTAGGFDTIGEALELSPVHLERYLEAASLALAEATVTTPRPETSTIRTDYSETWHEWNSPGFNFNQWTQSPEGLVAIRWNGINGPLGELGSWAPPVPDARYRFRFRVRAMIDKTGPNAPAGDATRPDRRIILQAGVAVWPGRTVVSDRTYMEISPTEFREFEYVARVPKGKTLWLSPYRAVPEEPDERAMVTGICAVVEWVEITGPLAEEWPPRGHRLLYGDLSLEPADPKQPAKDLRVVSPDPEQDARRLLAGFLPRAFRRPVSDAEVETHVALVRDELGKGARFDEALRAAYTLALSSPQFLFRSEKPGPLDDHALASRLSYGFWSTAPDEELTSLAAAGKLRDPAVLVAQTRRLINDPRRGKRFTVNLLDNWLKLRDIDFTQPDTKLYPEFEEYLQQSMLAESRAFFDELLAGDLPAGSIIDSDFAMLNERLAEHYGIPGVKGPQIRRVELPAGSHRGGFLTQGAVLKVSANGTTTSPVIRGAFVLERFLGIEPELPPKDVPAVEPDIRGATTIREQLARHRDQAACAACHAKLDPPGFALETFDVTGRWRTHYRALPPAAADKVVHVAGTDIRHYVPGPVVDPSYALADGRKFADIDGFKTLVLEDKRQVARALVGKFVAQLTGAEVEFADREVVEEILDRTEAGGYGVRSLLEEVVQSRLFTHK